MITCQRLGHHALTHLQVRFIFIKLQLLLTAFDVKDYYVA